MSFLKIDESQDCIDAQKLEVGCQVEKQYFGVNQRGKEVGKIGALIVLNLQYRN